MGSVKHVTRSKGLILKTAGPLAALLFIGSSLPAPAADNMKAFPPADTGMVRHVLHLPPQTDEYAFKLELIVGKTVPLDPDNRYFFAGSIEEETIQGWGFPRYIVRQLGAMAGTLMAVDPDAPKANRFVTLGGEPYLIRYNSRLPVVVYTPEGVEVRFRLWRSDPEAKPIGPG